ncbi:MULTISPECIES: h domain protein [Nocardioides]|uniref:Mce-associated membrane protein n=1 Tax=Nocardioides vastitatis TaxID=2568655 RepID=A0ABW0ZPH9_9ACTN|nr:h domain protein [Nocardioides sp.]THJ16031.1 h domain protein [Nocardioides sp.]
MTRSRMLAPGAVLVAVILGVFAGVQAHLAASTADARADALDAAKTRVPVLLSYDKTTLDEDLDRARAQTTGSFADDYEKILTEVVEPTAKRRGISTKATVSAAGVVSGDRDEAVVLLFLTQNTTAKGNRSSVSGSRVEVTLKRTGDDWKIAGLKPV